MSSVLEMALDTASVKYFVDVIKQDSAAMGKEVTTSTPVPFAPMTTLEFNVLRADTVKLALYNILGHGGEICNKYVLEGRYRIILTRLMRFPGQYYLKINIGGKSEIKRLYYY
jgi:hypothetical protein